MKFDIRPSVDKTEYFLLSKFESAKLTNNQRNMKIHDLYITGIKK